MDSEAQAFLTHVPASGVDAQTAQTKGMRRAEAISGRAVGSRDIWMGQTVVSPGAVSANHHHGRSETAIYVVAGKPVFVYLRDGAEVRIETSPGDYVYVPPFAAHREENPSTDEDAVVVIARTTQEAIVVNLDSLSDR